MRLSNYIVMGATAFASFACTPKANNSEVTQDSPSQDSVAIASRPDNMGMTLIDGGLEYSACLDCNIKDDFRQMNIYAPDINDGTNKRPVVFFVQGVLEGTAADYYRAFAQSGYVVAAPMCTNIKHEKDNDKTIKGLRCCMADLSDAIRFVKKRADKYQIDTTSIFIAGLGSGSEVVMTYAYIKGLYDKVDLNGVKGAISISAKTSLNFRELEKTDDIIPCIVLHCDQDKVASIEESRRLCHQVGELAKMIEVPEETENPTPAFFETLRVESRKFIDGLCTK